MPAERDTEPVQLDAWSQIDVMVPAQFRAAEIALSDPERRLRLAVLEDAIRICQRYGGATRPRERAMYAEALEWIASHDRADVFAFENVCDALELDPDYVRRGVDRWRATAPDGAPARTPRLSSRRVQPRPRPNTRRQAA